MSSVIDLRGVTVGYGESPVVHGLDLQVERGEIVALLGANGAGKTTTLLTIGGFLRPMAGTVDVLGVAVRPGRAHEVARRGLAHVPEGRSVFFGMSVEDNLRVGRCSRRGPARSHTFEVGLEHFPELGALRHRRAGDLSGGQQQMLALARALATRPSALLVDELSLGLAPIIVERLVGVLQDVAKTGEGAVLLVEQHVHIALDVADRLCLLEHGNLVAEGPTKAFLDRQGFLEESYLGHTS